jgi:hypothetical protein
MKILRSILFFLVLLAVAGAQPADAQFGRLGKKLKKKVSNKVEQTVEQRVEARVDRALDNAIGKSVDSIADELESSIEGLILSNEPVDIEVGDNESGDPDAPFVTYTTVSRINMLGSGAASKLLNRFGATRETTMTHGSFERVDQAKSSKIMDAESKKIIQIEHEAKQYWVMTFEEMMAPLEAFAEQGLPAAMDTPEMKEAQASMKPPKVTVERRDETKTVNGVPSKRSVVVVESEYEMSGVDEETGETMTMQGKSYTVLDQWHSTEVAGYNTIRGFQKKVAEAFMSSVDEDAFGGFIDAMKSAPAMQQSAAEGFKELGEIEGLPIKSTMHFVQIPPDGKFDLDAVLAENPSQEMSADPNAQRSLMTIISEIGDLSTAPVDLSQFGSPTSEGYTLVESPMKEALEMYQNQQQPGN